MSPSKEIRAPGSSGASGVRRMSALRLIPVPNAALGTQLFLRSLLVLAVALLVFGGLGAIETSRARRDGREDAAAARLSGLEARVTETAARAIATARRLGADAVVVRAARKLALARSATDRPVPFTDGERAVLNNRLAPHFALEPGGEAARFLKDRSGLFPEVLGVSLTEASGVLVASTEPPRDAVRASEEWWRRAFSDGLDVSLGGPATSVPRGSMSVAVAVDDPADRQRVGVLQLVLSLDALRAASGDASARLSAFDRAGRPLETGNGQPLLSDDPVLSPLATAAAGTIRAAFLRSGHDVVARRLDGAPGLTGWWVAVATPDPGTGPLGSALARRGALLLLLLAAATAVILPTLRRMTADLTALVEYARRTGAGDTAAIPPHVRRSDEIGALGSALVGALEGLRSSRVELERGKKSLEERVEARTSELARLNQELKKRAEELAAASRSKDEFLANISHELRTPLNSIIGLTQIVRDGLADTPEEANTFLDQVLHSSRHLLTLINDVLDLAKLEAGKVELTLEPLDAGEIVEEVRKIVEPLARQKGLAFEVSVASGIPTARADRVRLRQVLVNVAQNAIKFTETGHVHVRVRTSDGRRKLLLEVEDTGIGIPEAKRALVFEKFIQAEAGTTRRFGGTGLGLPISRLLVEAMGGAIGIESGANGAGTRVWFTVPTPGLEGR